MTILEAHTLIQLGLQEFGSFIHQDFEPSEIDIAINKTIGDIIAESVSHGERRRRQVVVGRAENQASLDAFRVLEVFDKDLPLLPFNEGFISTLPGGAGEEYLHLLHGKVKVSSDDCPTPVWVDYRVLDTKSLRRLLNTGLATTVLESPIASISGDSVRVYTLGKFTIEEHQISYYRKPAVVDFDNPPNGAGNIEFDYSMSNRIIDRTARYLVNIANQDSNKIANLDKLRQESD